VPFIVLRRFAVATVAALALAPFAAAASGEASIIAQEIGAAVAAQPKDAAVRREWIERVYEPAQPVWFTAQGRRHAIDAALRELRGAAERGLRAADYDADAMESIMEAAERDRTPRSVARADVAMTAAMLSLLSDARYGRVRPQDVEPHYVARSKPPAFVGGLREAAAGERIAELIDAAEPSFAQYSRLKRLLGRYRALASMPPIALPAPGARGGKVEPGERYEGAAALREALVRLNDLPADTPDPGDLYSHALASGVVRFQRRHGLAPDGVLGERTLAALRVPAAARVRQIELSLERLRWLPDLAPGPLVAINIPSFRLWAFDDASAAQAPALSMPVIVGKAMRGETPVFIGDMNRVEFSPYWNAPAAIARDELAPQLARDPSMLAREDMEIVTRSGAISTSADEAAIAALRAGEVRIRQRPGPKNALGGVKFVLPNSMNIYLHGTPARQLFERTRRDFSHGCIRVGDPPALARFALRGQSEWTAEAIDAAMAAGKTRAVKLSAPVPVVVFYTTAIADAEGGALFLPDVYGHDERLARALAKRR
jgi:murein L,D-transpeptidase YcbB/YkuD